MDPLTVLPPEVVLRILNFASLATIANLTRSSQSWHDFIDSRHQDVIYAALSPGVKNLHEPGQSLSQLNSFSQLGKGIRSWKDACRVRLLLERSWKGDISGPRENIIQVVGRHPVWRFRPDFKRRFFISTSHAGGINVTDMDTGQRLWALDKEQVRPFAHIEYQDGTVVWDRFGNSLEVWKTDLPGLERGQFQQVAVLDHSVETRGFQLSYDTLCVVSTEGEGFVYSIPEHLEKPILRTHVCCTILCPRFNMEIEDEAIGHLDQDETAVMYSIGTKGYHVHDKQSGQLLGHIHPQLVKTSEIYHVHHPPAAVADDAELGYLSYVSSPRFVAPPRDRQRKHLVHLPIKRGRFTRIPPGSPTAETVSLDADDWGAGMLNGTTMVGISRGGRLVICSDWRRALRSEEEFASVTSVIECDPSGDTLDLGGWLHIHETIAGKLVIFEIKDHIYIVSLDAGGRLDTGRPVLAAATSSAPQLAVPVSFMGIYDDCIVSTFTTIGMQSARAGQVDDDGENVPEGLLVYFPTKAIRVLSFVPDL
ncbi:hypothetical protein F4779DRAFT_616188 [Xylariaceae sp. FL0662B]|nr:hypothetical protein F4779DRAFT_616188 [Xylariaceae sp. FL0662B]